MIPRDRVEELFLQVWGEQSCQVDPAHWDPPPQPADAPARIAVLAALLAPNDGTRTSYRPRVEYAISELVRAFARGVPADAPALIWRLFPHFTRVSCQQLADLLAAEVGGMRAAAE
jgi:hypothetical protein